MSDIIEINNVIDEKIKELNNTIIDRTDLDYLNKFDTNLFKLMDYDQIELLIAFVMANAKKSYKEISNTINPIKDYIECIFEMEPHEIVDFCESLYQGTSDIDNIENMDLRDFLELKLKNHNYKVTLRFFKRVIKENGLNQANDIFKILTNNDYRDMIAFIGNIKEFKESVDENKGDNLDEFIESKIDIFGNIPSSDLKKIIKSATSKTLELLENHCSKLLSEPLNMFKNYKSSLAKKISKEEKEKNYKIRDYTDLKNILEKGKLDLDTLKKYNIDEMIYNMALKIIIEEQNKEYESVYEKLCYYREKDINKLEVLFHKNGYNFNLLNYGDQEKLNGLHNVEDIEDKLIFIKGSNLSFVKETDDVFINLILLNKNLLIILDKLVARGRISQSFIINNSNLINPINLNNVLININLLEELKIDFEKLNNYKDTIIYTIDHELLKEIKSYDIKCSASNTNNYSFLENRKLLLMIDMFIELGLMDIVKNNPNLISINSIDVIKRINIMMELKENFINSYGTLNQAVYKGKDFYIGDSSLDNYIYINYSNYMNPEIKNIIDNSDIIGKINEIPDEIDYLNEFDYKDGTYRINHMIFSKNKVLRILNILYNNGYNNYNEMLFNALIYSYPMYLSSDDIEMLKNIIYQNNNKRLLK